MARPVVAIAGFTGKLARLFTKSLVENLPEVEIHGIVRSTAKLDATVRDLPNVKVFEASAFDTAALRRGLKGASVCVCCYLGDPQLMVEGQKALIDACIDEGVERYVASDWSLDFWALEFWQHPENDPGGRGRGGRGGGGGGGGGGAGRGV